MQVCSLCKTEKPLSEYYIRTNKGTVIHRKDCKICICKRSMQFYKEHPQKYDSKRSNKYRNTARGMFKTYEDGAKKRGLIWRLGEGYFKNILSNPMCHYCGRIVKENARIGVDRKDPTIGYKIGNVVPCCSKCNFMKGKMQYEDFVNQCREIVKNRGMHDSN